MSLNKLLWLAIIIALAASVFGQPHIVMGSLRNSDNSYPNPDCIIFEAWMTARPTEILTQESDGCDVADTMWFVNIGSFHTAPDDGEELNIWFRDTCLAETLTVTGTVTIPGAEENWGSFTLVQELKEIDITYPNGGDYFYWDDPIDITWNTVGIVTDVAIKYSPNAGLDWFPVSLSTPNDGLFEWSAPHITSYDVLFWIYEVSDPSVDDVSDGFTIITQAPSVQMDYPNGGELFWVDDVETIEWSTAGPVGTVELHISYNGGADWVYIDGGLGGRGTYDWTVVGDPSTNCLFRVRDEGDTAVFDVSDAVFEIDTVDLPPPVDTIPPAQTTDLSVIEVEPTRAHLTWTAPGDDENVGTATEYIMGYDVFDFDWPPANFVPAMPAPQPAGSDEDVWIEDLDPETEYWAALITHDEVPNESPVSNMVNFTTPAIPDTIPPADFVIDTVESRGISWDEFDIYWEAPGDDGDVGTASYYDFRFSTSAITEGNFDISPELTEGVPDPLPAGTPQMLTVSGLEPETDYWIAGRAFDDEDNPGPISNVLMITTPEYVDEIQPDRITDLTCGDLDPNAIELIFTAPGDDGDTGIVGIGYEIRYQPDVDFDPIDWTFVPVYDTIPPMMAGTEVHVYVEGLDSGREYFFTVRSLDDDGPDSDPSFVTGCWTIGTVGPIPDLVRNEDDPDTNLPPLSGVFHPPSGMVYDVVSTEEGVTATLVDSSYVRVGLELNYFGESWIIITATDGEDVLYDSVYVTVNPVNDPPVFISFPEDTLLLDGFPWNYLAIADDADGDVVSYFLSGGPIGMEVDITGYVDWLPIDIEGTYNIQIAAWDAEDTTIQEFNLVVIKYTHPVFFPQNLEALDGFRGCIPVMWDAPPAVSTGLPVNLSHYRLYRSEYFDIGYSVVADSVPYNSYSDNTVDPGRLYFYKVQAVYRDPDFNSGFSNIDGGASLDGNLLYSNYTTTGPPSLDGNLNELPWFEATMAVLTDDAEVLLANDLHYLYVGLRMDASLVDGYTFRFFFDDNYSRTWDPASSTEGYYEMTYEAGMPSVVYFHPINVDSVEPAVVSSGALAAWETVAPGDMSLELVIDMTLLEEFFALPADTIGVALQLLNEVGTPLLNWPVGADFYSADELATLLLGAPGGVPQFQVSPLILDVELETGWETDVPMRLINTGDGTAVWSLEEDAAWLNITPESGIIPPGTEIGINAHFVSGILDTGLYTSAISFFSNDPIVPEQNVPVEFTVTPKVPSHYLEVYPPNEITASPGDLIEIPIYVGETYTNEITQLDFAVLTNPDFITPLTVNRGAGLPADWTLIVRNISFDRVLVRLIGPEPISGEAEVIKIEYAVSTSVLVGRSCRIDIADLIFNYGLDDLPIPVPMSGVLVIGDEIRFFWSGMLVHYDTAWERQDSIRFGLLDASTENYDPGIDVLNLPPFPGHNDAWFLSDDWRMLGTDIRPTGGYVTWVAYFEDDGYIVWDRRQMWEGLIMDGWLDMTEDSLFEVHPDEPVIITYNSTPGEFTWEIDIKRGWNMISAPIVAPSMSVSALFPTSIGGVWRWSNSLLSYVEELNIQIGRGYWLLSNRDTTYTRTGNAVYNYDRSLPTGWVMLGSPAHRTYLEDQDITPPGASMEGTFYYYDTEGIPRYRLTDEFVPGRAQWIFCSEPAIARISSIYLPKEAPDVERIPELSGEIYIEDDPGQFVSFAMVDNPMDRPAPPAVPGTSNRITLDGEMPLFHSEVSPARSAEWTGKLELAKNSAIGWKFIGEGEFVFEVDGISYNMSDWSGIEIQAGAHNFKVTVRKTLPDKFALLPSVPNPFNAATRLRFALPEDSEITLSIYDITGRSVRKLVEGETPAGYHRAVWDGRTDAGKELPSGIYFSVLKTGDRVFNRKLLLIK
ncbi:hypothetical protein DRQ36_01125 [bacterium]|nr:MAG: hypothetical protein DRQ36_01125 [bacterium]